jgi:GGDEF domain-containing protein
MATNLFSPLLTVIAVGLGAWCLHLRRELQVALVDPTYGILTRLGGERRWKHLRSKYEAFEVVFLDVDDLHQMNKQLGYEEVDRRLRSALNFRQEDIVMARWYSGDEIVAIVPKGDGAGFAQRLLRNLQSQQLSATFGIVPAEPALADAVRRAMEVVAAAKANGQRGIVCAAEATTFPRRTAIRRQATSWRAAGRRIGPQPATIEIGRQRVFHCIATRANACPCLAAESCETTRSQGRLRSLAELAECHARGRWSDSPCRALSRASAGEAA